jgi:hypothetical protein
MFDDQPMDDWVAVEVKTDSGCTGFFVTWGRIQDAVDPRPLEELTLRVATRFSIGGRPMTARVCANLREAAAEPDFYEALLTFAQKPIPYGAGHNDWRREKAKTMEEGQESTSSEQGRTKRSHPGPASANLPKAHLISAGAYVASALAGCDRTPCRQ